MRKVSIYFTVVCCCYCGYCCPGNRASFVFRNVLTVSTHGVCLLGSASHCWQEPCATVQLCKMIHTRGPKRILSTSSLVLLLYSDKMHRQKRVQILDSWEDFGLRMYHSSKELFSSTIKQKMSKVNVL